jgi:glycosyltransferase involved in cell wall biosynthesis
VVHVLEATVGGTRRHVLDLCHGLPSDRFEQHLVCSLRTPAFQADIATLRAAGVRVTLLPMRREISPPSDLGALAALTSLLHRERPDIVHGHSAKGGFLARLAARRVAPRPATVYSPHGFAFQMAVSGLRRWGYLQFERWAGRYTDRLVAVCPSQLALALEHRLVPPGCAVLIRNGVDPSRAGDPALREAVRAEWGIGPKVPVFGTVAALAPQKDIATLVRAAAVVRRELPEARCVIVGDGPQRAELERLAASLGCADRVSFLGQRPDVPRLLTGMDAFVLPSLWEGLPYALLEAGLAGLPVVATDVPGNRDLIDPGETGLLARAGDPDDLAARVVELWRSPDRAAMAERLGEVVRRQYHLEQMLAGHAGLYESLAARR